MDDDTYRNKKKNNQPKLDYSKEDADYYGYTDNNAGKPIDADFTPVPMGELNETTIYRKRKKNKINLVRKPTKKCKCK